MEFFTLNLLNGVAFGFILFLLASGLSLALGVMGVLNLAHGVLYMVGAYLGWTIAIKLGMNFWLAVLVAAIAAGILGLVMERGFFRYLHGLLNEQVLLTFGFIYFITNIVQWIWGTIPKAPFTAPFLAGSFPVGTYTYPYSRIAAIVIGLILAGGMWWLLDKTKAGAIIRAGMDDKEMTTGLGINVGLVATAIFSLGAFIAGAVGVLGTCIFGITLDLGLDVLLYALVIVVIGGMGSIPGALLGSMIIGIADSFIQGLSPDFAAFSMYFIMIIILLIKPTGLLGKRTV